MRDSPSTSRVASARRKDHAPGHLAARLRHSTGQRWLPFPASPHNRDIAEFPKTTADRDLLINLLAPFPNGAAVAENLLDDFGDLPRILCASKERLRAVGASTAAIAAHIATVRAIMRQLARVRVAKNTVIGNLPDLHRYLDLTMAHELVERVRVVFLDYGHRLMADEEMASGTVTSTDLPMREVLRRALELGASGLVLVHNHPSGDTTPSESDRRLTRQFLFACEYMGIALHDHLIVGRSGYSSFRELGLL